MAGAGRESPMRRQHRPARFAWPAGLAASLLASGALAQPPQSPTPLIAPIGDGIADDTAAIQTALNAAVGLCATVRLQCTWANTFKVSATINVPRCVKLVGECGAVPDEGASAPVGTTLAWTGGTGLPVVALHDSPGAAMRGVSINCQDAAAAIGIQYSSDDSPPGSFVDIDTLMIAGCHQGLVIGLANNTAAPSCTPQIPAPGNCAEADQLRFSRFRILGNLKDALGEGVHLNSANGAQGSLINDGNLQGVNIGIHVISTNGGLVIENTNIGSELGVNPSFITIEPSTAASPTLINNEVEAPLGTTVAAVLDHGCNPFGTPGTPVWLNNVWNAHAVVVDGSENVTSIGNLANSGTVTSSNSCGAAPHVLSLNENGWGVAGAAAAENLATITNGGATFNATLFGKNVIEGLGPSCPFGNGAEFPPNVLHGDLVSCQGQHAGRVWLGQDLNVSNNGDGGLVLQGQLVTRLALGGTAPSIASGFGTAPAIVGTSNAGRITLGATGAASGVVSFGTAFANPPLCVAQDETTTSAMRASASTTQLTITGTMAPADTLTYICLGFQ
jgi:hypothetical protein